MKLFMSREKDRATRGQNCIQQNKSVIRDWYHAGQ